MKFEEGDVVMFEADRWGSREVVDGNVLSVDEHGVHVVWLQGHSSRNETIAPDEVLAKVNLDLPWIRLEGTRYSGNLEFPEKVGCD